MYKKKSLLWAISLLTVFKAFAQVGIGVETPDSAAILDVNSTNKGILIPRVTLKSATVGLNGANSQPAGLLIYNEAGGAMDEGFYFWSGTEWQNLKTSASVVPKISKLEVEHAAIEPKMFTAGVYYSGILKVPYTGGNGGKYPAGTCINSVGNTGLKACLKAGVLENGIGYLVYDLTGTPAAKSPVGATFSIEFDSIKSQVTVGDSEEATVMTTISLGPFIAASDNGVKGFHRVVSSFDGKFSVRIFIKGNDSFNLANIQIRSNTTDNVKIMWNVNVSNRGGDTSQAGNSLTLQNSKMWYGNVNRDTSKPVTSGGRTYWGVEGIRSPEQRSYIWTTTDVNDKTIYHLTFMTSSNIGSTSASDKNIDLSRVFMRLEQIRAD
ncbi:MAG: hypothetical protein LBK65_01995 [Tannerellaceae bacterium]|jgi:hypothetical protein|nr:hypothetical protein [Tannerellaceae bacterium]